MKSYSLSVDASARDFYLLSRIHEPLRTGEPIDDKARRLNANRLSRQ